MFAFFRSLIITYKNEPDYGYHLLRLRTIVLQGIHGLEIKYNLIHLCLLLWVYSDVFDMNLGENKI